MPALKKVTPKYRRHRASGQAIVRLAGHPHYLGPFGTEASHREYDRLVGEWLAAGRPSRQTATCKEADLTDAELLPRYLEFAEKHYRLEGKPTSEIDCVKHAMKPVKALYSRTAANDFGPLALRAVREKMIKDGLSRRNINRQVLRVRRIWKWAASRELVPIAVYQALVTVEGLEKGRSDAVEMAPVGPDADVTVEATLPFLSPVVANMVRLQRLLGCRPRELCLMRRGDVNRAGDVWEYRPHSHKTQHHGRE